MARDLRVSPPPIDEVLGAVRESGYRVSRAHYSGTAIKTDAPVDVLERAVAGER
jgi:tRNA (guanine26-N2/guanine27-N2)-dimethyltransferase